MYTPTRRANRVALTIAIAGGLLAFALRLYYVLHAQVLQPLDDPNVRADAVDYYRYAWNLVHQGVFASDAPGAIELHPNSFRDPGYALLLAGWMCVTSTYANWYAAVLLTQAFLGGATVSLLALALRSRLSTIALGASTIIMAMWPHSVAMTSFVLSETLLGFLCALSLFLLDVTVAAPSRWRLVVTGLCLGMASLTNAVLIPFGVVVAIVLGCRHLLTTRAAAALALVSMLLPTLWGIRSLTIAPSYSSTHRATMNLVQGSWPTYHAAYQLAMKGDPDGIRTITTIDAEIAAFQQSNVSGLSGLMERMGRAPLAYLTWYASKPALLWDWDIRIGQGDVYVYPTRNSPFRVQPAWKVVEAACFLINPVVMLLALSGSLIAVARRHPPGIDIAFAVVALMVTLVYTALQAEPRYSSAFRGVEIGLAALALQELATLLRARRTEARDLRHNSSLPDRLPQ